MTEMVERVARALCRLDCQRRAVACTDCGDDWSAFEGDACAVFTAMREPTAAMAVIGDRTIDPYGNNLHPTAIHAYRAMIDAALA